MEKTYTRSLGARPDPRSDDEKAKDWQHHEFLAGVAPVTWTLNLPSLWPKYSVRNQDGSSSCVGQACAKAIETITHVPASAHTTYARRVGFPQEGMYLADAGKIVTTIGATTEALDPSQNMNEEQMNQPVKVDTNGVLTSYFFIPVSAGIDAVAAAIDQYRHVVWTFNIAYDEWDMDVPTVNPATTTYDGGHANCGTFRTLWQGQKAIVDDDSWGMCTKIGTGGQRIITEAFFKARCTGVMVLVPWVEPTGQKPQHTFTMNLSAGVANPKEVIALQNCLKWSGCMSSAIPSSGIFGPQTLAAVVAFQERYTDEILAPEGLTNGTGIVGPATIKKLNALYGISK